MYYKSTAFNGSVNHLNHSIIIPLEHTQFNTVQFLLDDGRSVRVRVDIEQELAVISCVKAVCLIPKSNKVVDQFGVSSEFSYIGHSLMFTGESQKNFSQAFFNRNDVWLDAIVDGVTVKEKILLDGNALLNAAELTSKNSHDFTKPTAYYLLRETVTFPKNGVVWHFANLGNITENPIYLNVVSRIQQQLSGSNAEYINLTTFLDALKAKSYKLDKRSCWNKGRKNQEPTLKRQYRILVESGLMDISYFM